MRKADGTPVYHRPPPCPSCGIRSCTRAQPHRPPRKHGVTGERVEQTGWGASFQLALVLGTIIAHHTSPINRQLIPLGHVPEWVTIPCGIITPQSSVQGYTTGNRASRYSHGNGLACRCSSFILPRKRTARFISSPSGTMPVINTC